MIRFCPNCETERGPHEVLCEGQVDGHPCGWDLSHVPFRDQGWRPTGPQLQPDVASVSQRCTNGHAVGSGDLLCAICNADVAEVATCEPVGAHPPPAVEETVIEGWRLGRRIPSPSQLRERFVAVHVADGRQAVLTLYSLGSEPDPAVYDVLRSLSLDHIPEIKAIGRWHHQAFEVVEELMGGTLADLGLLSNDAPTLSRVIDEVGRALHSFSIHGLRHRDLRPSAILVRVREPLDLVVTGFGSARLSEFDLDIVAPLETTRYTAPEAIAGGVAAASDWWSLGMILLELLTRGGCFEGVNEQAFLIHVLTNGVEIPETIEPPFQLLLRGLLARNHRERWSWSEVKQWLDGETPRIPTSTQVTEALPLGPTIKLAGREYATPTAFALAAADSATWVKAREMFIRGVVTTWAVDAGLDPKMQARLRHLATLEDLTEDFRFSLALKALNPAIPLTCRGDIVTPGWLLEHPDEGYALITGPLPDILRRTEAENWLLRLKKRAELVRDRIAQLEVAVNEEEVRVHLLATSRSRLAAMWEDRRHILPETDHPALEAILERHQTSEEDLILLLSAQVGQFRTADAIVADAAEAASLAGLAAFDPVSAGKHLLSSRRDMYAAVDKRIEGFARCDIPRIDEWVDQFRLERRLPLARVLVVLSVPQEAWREPPKQAYVATLLDFFARRVAGSVQRGPLARMTIGKTTPRVDLVELGSERATAGALLDRILLRGDEILAIDPSVFYGAGTLERRARALYSHATLYRRDTGINGLYLGFPFLLMQGGDGTTRTRIAPVLLWPAHLHPEVGGRGRMSIGFDRDREEVRLNPAFEGLVGPDGARLWQEAAQDVLGRSSVKAASVMDALGGLATPLGRTLEPLPGRDVRVTSGHAQLSCSAVLFHLAYIGQAVVEDLRQLKGRPPTGTALETALRVSDPIHHPEVRGVRELERFLTAPSDPSQEAAVSGARSLPGLVVQGPPGTGKSQTIVNMVADAIGREKSLLVVCQKQAALEVVRKRLDAEGLAERIVMITDVNKDREPIIRAVRNQVEAMHGAWRGGVGSGRSKREQVASRIESLEAELDQHHEALHQVDDATGLTYRELIGELVRLEETKPAPIDAPSLRSLLAGLDPGRVATVEEACGPLAGQWLPARVEGSPLTDLKVFTADPGTISLFRSDFDAFVASEDHRRVVIARTPAAFTIKDPEVYRDWLDAHADTFRHLSPDQRQDLSTWLPLFELSDGKVQRESMIGELDAIGTGISGLGGDDPLALPEIRRLLVQLDDKALGYWLALAEELVRPASLLGRFSLLRWKKSRRLNAFLEDHSLGPLVSKFRPLDIGPKNAPLK